MPKNPIDYANGIQYKIVCNDPAITDCYNGSCCSFKDRKYTHKSKCNSPNSDGYNLKVYRFIREHGGWDNWTMIQLEESPCESKQELVKREREIFDILKPTLNTNSPTLDVEKIKKRQVKYADNNKVKLAAKRKQCYDENKVELVSKQRQYRSEHKVEIAAKQKQYSEAHKVENSVYRKQYRDEHKAILSAKQIEKVKCVCGCVSSRSNLSIHQKSKKHLKLMDQLK